MRRALEGRVRDACLPQLVRMATVTGKMDLWPGSEKLFLLYMYMQKYTTYFEITSQFKEGSVIFKNALGIFLNKTKMKENLDSPDDFLKYFLSYSSKMFLKYSYADEE